MRLRTRCSGICFHKPLVSYKIRMPEIEIRQTLQYSRWFSRLRDVTARARIDVRIRIRRAIELAEGLEE
jgi:hypothetical protein